MAEPCPERWADEVGCADGQRWHDCGRTGNHGTHMCQRCDAMVLEDASVLPEALAGWVKRVRDA